MYFKKLHLKGAYIIKMKPHLDKRGYFSRMFCKNEFKKRGLAEEFVQISSSFNTKKGQIRGMHYQKKPYEETKLVKCVRGSLIDVIVDLRENSSTYMKWHSEKLTADDYKMIYVPKGFAHGYKTLEPNTNIIYFMDEKFNPSAYEEMDYNTLKCFDED